jgi:hypothetical protein
MSILDQYSAQVRSFRRTYLASDDIAGAPILVDMMHSNLEYVAISLSVASSIRLATKRPLVGLIGRAGQLDSVMPPYDDEAIRLLGEAHGVERFIDMHAEILATDQAGDWLAPLREISTRGEDGSRMTPEDIDAVKGFVDPDGFPLGRFIMDTTLRATLTPSLRYGSDFSRWLEYLGQARGWAASFFAAEPVTAIAVGHSDYCPHGFLAEFGLSRGVPAVLWTASDRSAFLVNALRPGQTFIGACREANVAAFAEHEAAEAERNADPREADALARLVIANDIQIARTGLAGDVSAIEGRILDIRAELFDNDPRPIVCLFAHTYSDVPCQDDALYRDHQEWLERTLAAAVEDQTYNLLIKAHPLDSAYDVSGLTAALDAAFSDNANIAFYYGPIENQVLARDCALGVTVRGTPGFLLPAMGLRMVLAGRSVFSDVGVAATPESHEAYLDQLRQVGEAAPLTEAEIASARRFLAFHLLTGSRRKSDVPILRSDGRDSPFFAHAGDLLKTWIPEECEVARDLARLWSPISGFEGGPASIRIGGRLPAPQREDATLQEPAPEPVEPEAEAPKPGLFGWLARKFAMKPTEVVELYKSDS